nr:hypothetical protein [Tanacetum cinerariifolium]
GRSLVSYVLYYEVTPPNIFPLRQIFEGDGNGNGGFNGNGNPNQNDIGAMLVARKWFEKMETIFHISNYPKRYQVKYAMCTLLNSALTWWNAHKRTIGVDAAFAMSWRELMKLMTEDAIRIANNLMDQKLKGYAAKSVENKRRLDNNQKDNRVQQPPYKRQNVGGQIVARAYMASNNERRGYDGPLPYCNKCKLHHEGLCTVKCEKCNKVRHMAKDCMNVVGTTTTQRGPVVNQRVGTCFKCGSQGHFKKDCPKLKNQNRGNKMGNKTNKARGKAYVLGEKILTMILMSSQ